MASFKMSGILLKHLFRKAKTVRYPSEKKKMFPRTRGSIGIDISLCIFCGICRKKCPTGAITVDKPAKAWGIDRGRCILCNACVEVCPKKCLVMGNAFAATALTRDELRFRVEQSPVSA
ncbi:MAG: hypothetical protein A2293_01475 [Elusimicrobia bacterium RIFOXYB2_FULL_49_7]|nr:MAG: hypothetical protein A2293_01475 [Elusimicrobia bacterium RIFOXYB2_FULL_49_7]